MLFMNKIEESLIMSLLKEERIKPNQAYLFKFYNGLVVEAKLETFYETCNEYEMDEPEYMEYYACAIKIDKVHNLPREVMEEDNFKKGRLYEVSGYNLPQKIEANKGRVVWEDPSQS